MSRAVAISGAGCLCAAGMTLDEAFAAMLRGERNPQPPRAFRSDHAEPFPVFEILTPLPVPGSDAELLRTTRLALSATSEALADAGLDGEQLRGLKVGVCIGTTVGSAMNNEDFYREFRDGGDPSMAPIERYLRSNPAAALARHYQLDGPCQVVVNACSSGTDAIGLGAAWIRAGLCDIALVGGADELCRTTYNGFASLMIADTGPCKPFDARRRGLNLGEGAGLLVLESSASLAKREKTPRGFVLGYGSATDAYHLTAPHPDGNGLRRALAETLTMAGVASEELAFINAHGTGTPDNDRVENRVLADLFPTIPFVSTKCYTGHTLGAAGAIEAALTLVALEQRMLPANAGFDEQDPELPTRPVSTVTPLSGRFALSESLAFGGNNAAVLLGLEVPR
ncbi:MAG: beta-ketoacyl-[acyl-carrier-protein] synthase family protein [Desulfuromonadaceae bacterium]|nr:beta-ketoacyl-[acyl-carrier-protein] synthase family protein [Desulfuromonadaceae bacterium]